MRVACPACDAAYDIPDHVLAAGTRRLRCARCHHEWAPSQIPPGSITPDPVAPDPITRDPVASGPMALLDGPALIEAPPPPAAAAPPAPAGPLELPEPPAAMKLVASPPLTTDRMDAATQQRSTGLAVAAWVASVVLLAGIVGAAYVFRGAVQTAWPPSQLLYAALGLG